MSKVGLPKDYKDYQSLPYRLKRLNLQSLKLCRLHTDLIMCYKIVFGLGDVHKEDFYEISTITHITDTSYSRNVIMAASVFPSFASVSWRSGIIYLLTYLVLLQRSNVPFIMLILVVFCSDSCIVCIMMTIYWLHNCICIFPYFLIWAAAIPCCPAHSDFVLHLHSISSYFIRPNKMMMMMMQDKATVTMERQ